MKFNFFRKKKEEPKKEKEYIFFSDGSTFKEDNIKLEEPFTLAKHRLEHGAKDKDYLVACKMYNNHKTKLNNQWFNPSMSVNSGWGTIQHSLYNYQNVNYYECMLLSQDPLMAKILNLLSDTPFKKGGKIAGNYSKEELEDFEKLAKYWKIEDIFKKALKESFACGGCLVYLDFGLNENLSEPIDLKNINLRRFKGFRLIQAINCSAVDVNTFDPTKEDYMKPKKWYVVGLGVVDSSRFLFFSQNEQPDILKPLSLYFGYPLTQLIKQDVANSNIISQGIAELMGKFRYNFLKTSKSNFTTNGVENFKCRLKFDLNCKDNFGYSVISEEEDVIQQTTSLSGLRENHEMSYLLISSKTSIPYTELMGKSAEGMNATGTGDRKIWYDKIENIRNSIIPNLLKVYGIIAGLNDGKFKIFEDFIFEPLEELTEKEQVEVFKAKIEIGKELIETYGAENTAVLDWLKTDKRLGIENIEIDLTTPNLLDYGDISENETFTEKQNSRSLL
jgi:phage-related protein (TIGR01555 family)